MGSNELVAVVVPAYNAEETIGETLESIRNQTYADLEIVVVDDGSTDGTVRVAEAHAAADIRVRVLSIQNGGVAAARNTGIAATRASFVAFIDADDVWHPEKIAKQMSSMLAGGPDTGFVYCLTRKIDAEGRVLANRNSATFEGYVYLRHLLYNFVGNGSSLLVRREALEEAGGFEPALHRAGAQGCEDYLLQLMIARSWKVACVPEYLTGHRRLPNSMSRDLERMARSRFLMLEQVAHRFPRTPAGLLRTSEAMVRARLGVVLLRKFRPRDAARHLLLAAGLDGVVAAKEATGTALDVLLGIVQRMIGKIESPPGPQFRDLAPDQDFKLAEPHLLERRLRALSAQEASFARRAERVPASDSLAPLFGRRDVAAGKAL